MTHTKKEANNLSLAVIFIGVILFFISLSILFKMFFLFRQSQFDGSNKFNVQIVDSKKTEIISFSPKENSISVLKLDRRVEGDLSKNLEIPIDGIIVFKNYQFNDSNISSALIHSIFSFGNTRFKLTSIDLIRLTLFSRKVPRNSIYIKELMQNYTDTQRFNVLYLIFKDPLIFTENNSIEIINATDVFGLGNRLATLISAIGGNVIFVKSQDPQSKSKIQYLGNKNHTIERISKYLNFPAEQIKSRGVSDVIITIGKDSLKNLKF